MLNNLVQRPYSDKYIHPLNDHRRRHPRAFDRPRQLRDLVYMDDAELDDIMITYNLRPGRGPYYDGHIRDDFDSGYAFHRSNSRRRRNLLALFEYFGAFQLVDCPVRCL
jgi:hypothetical protein